MKANVFTSICVAMFLFAINVLVVKADSDATLFHNVEKQDNVVSTTYFKSNGTNENLIPFKKKVNTLNEQGMCVSKVTYIWNAYEKNWTPLDRMDYTYNGQAVVGINRYAWNDKSKDWGKPQVVSYNYNDEGVLAK